MSSSQKILWPFEVSSYRKVRRGRLLLFLNFFCKTMLPHQGYSRPENPKRHGFDSSIKLSPLQNYGIMNLQNHGLSDSVLSFNPWFCRICKTMPPFLPLYWLPGTSVRKIANFAFSSSLFTWHVKLERGKSRDVLLAISKKKSQVYE